MDTSDSRGRQGEMTSNSPSDVIMVQTPIVGMNDPPTTQYLCHKATTILPDPVPTAVIATCASHVTTAAGRGVGTEDMTETDLLLGAMSRIFTWMTVTLNMSSGVKDPRLLKYGVNREQMFRSLRTKQFKMGNEKFPSVDEPKT